VSEASGRSEQSNWLAALAGGLYRASFAKEKHNKLDAKIMDYKLTLLKQGEKWLLIYDENDTWLGRKGGNR